MPRILCTVILLWSSLLSVEAAELLKADVANKQAAAGSVYLIDIRRPNEWKNSGVAQPAHKISMHQNGFLEKLARLTDGRKDAPIALICATGARSTYLAGELEKRGFTNILNVSEGMFGSQAGPGWLRRNLPTKPHG